MAEKPAPGKPVPAQPPASPSAPTTPPAQPAPPPETAPAPPPAPQASNGERKAASEWTTNEAGLQLIRDSEGLRLTAYNNGGQWLIGYGHSDGVTQGMTITKEQAEAFLRQDVRTCEHFVGQLVTVPVSQNEFSAMVSFCYNVGHGNFQKSSILSKLNAGDRQGAADAFLLWVKAGGKEVPHLVTRRQAERALFLS
ncbi:MAG: lysozyme [Alphaproteobacteria bacterium]